MEDMVGLAQDILLVRYGHLRDREVPFDEIFLRSKIHVHTEQDIHVEMLMDENAHLDSDHVDDTVAIHITEIEEHGRVSRLVALQPSDANAG